MSPVLCQQWNILRPSMFGVASHLREWAHSLPCPKTLPWIKNDIKTLSKSNSSHRSRSTLCIGFVHFSAWWSTMSQGKSDHEVVHRTDVLDLWPGNSPDFNPIENLWSILKKWENKQKLTSCKHLRAMIRYEWAALSQDVVQNLRSSMPKWIAEGST